MLVFDDETIKTYHVYKLEKVNPDVIIVGIDVGWGNSYRQIHFEGFQ